MKKKLLISIGKTKDKQTLIAPIKNVPTRKFARFNEMADALEVAGAILGEIYTEAAKLALIKTGKRIEVMGSVSSSDDDGGSKGPNTSSEVTGSEMSTEEKRKIWDDGFTNPWGR